MQRSEAVTITGCARQDLNLLTGLKSNDGAAINNDRLNMTCTY